MDLVHEEQHKLQVVPVAPSKFKQLKHWCSCLSISLKRSSMLPLVLWVLLVERAHERAHLLSID
eukprot:10873407-Prorocentrum_lima.AAC.1